jgi:ribosomal protein S19E (S16A)
MKKRVGRLLGFSLRAAAIVGAIMLFGVLVFSLTEQKYGSEEQSSTAPPHEKQFADADLEKHLTAAVDKVRPQLPSIALGGVISGPPQASNKLIADGIASKLKSLPAEYNKPDTLLLGDSTPVQFVIKTNEKQEIPPLFKGLEGELAKTTALVAQDVSAKLTGPPDMLAITPRDDAMRAITSAAPIVWVWDVKPLKPGKALITIEVTSYIKTGKDKETVPIRVIEDTWQVDARGLEWVKYQIQQIEPVRAFVFTMGGGIASVLAWFGIKGFGKG